MRMKAVLVMWVLLGALMSGCWRTYVVGIIYEDVPSTDADVSDAGDDEAAADAATDGD